MSISTILMEATQTSAQKTLDLSELEEDADIEVVTEFQPRHEAVSKPEGELDVKAETPSEITTNADGTHERSTSWTGYIKKKLENLKGDPSERVAASEQKKRDWSKEQEALAKLKSSAASTLSQVGSKFGEGGVYLYEASKRTAQATAENIKKIRLFKSPIEAVCKNEGIQRPCPRILLVCCTAIAAGGLSTKEIFKREPAEELVNAISGHFLKVLHPNGATPEVLAGVIKRFLMDLDEPLLTYKLSSEWIAAGQHPQTARQLMEQLPPANANSLDILLDCLNRVAFNAFENQMDADALAEAISPCLLWKFAKPLLQKRGSKTSGGLKKAFSKAEAPDKDDSAIMVMSEFSPVPVESPSSGSAGSEFEKQGKVTLDEEELGSFEKAISFLIANHSSLKKDAYTQKPATVKHSKFSLH